VKREGRAGRLAAEGRAKKLIETRSPPEKSTSDRVVATG
jgi:hypothetical protein